MCQVWGFLCTKKLENIDLQNPTFQQACLNSSAYYIELLFGLIQWYYNEDMEQNSPTLCVIALMKCTSLKPNNTPH